MSADPPPRLLERAGEAGTRLAGSRPSHPGVRLALRIALVVAIAAAIAFALGSQWRRLPDFAWRFEPGWLAVSIVGFLFMLALHAEGWRQILIGMGHPLPRTVTRAIWARSILARYVPTNALLVVIRVGMSGRRGVPQRVTLASLVYEVPLQLSGALAVGAYFVTRLEALQGQPVRYLVALIPVLAITALHPAIFHRAVDWAFARVGRDPLPVSLSFPRVLGVWALYAVSFVVAGVGIGGFTFALYPVDPSGIPALLSAWSVGFGVAVLAFFSPAGLGAREAGLAAALAAAVPTGVAVAVAVASRILVTVIELVFAGVSALVVRRHDAREAPEAAPAAPAAPPDAAAVGPGPD